jgi:prolyl-tRNA synthetase
MRATFLDDQGKERVFEMGCYGIGVTRIVGAAIEQGHDDRGIVWPDPIAPFRVAIVPLGYRRSEAVRKLTDELYARLQAAGVEVLLDDRDERPGVLLADVELIGIPHRVVIGDRGLKDGRIEYQRRSDTAPTSVPTADAVAFLEQRLCVRS